MGVIILDKPCKVYTVKTVLGEFFQGNVGETKLREMVRKGEIPHFRVGTKILFRKDSLDEWVNGQEQVHNSKLVNRLRVV